MVKKFAPQNGKAQKMHTYMVDGWSSEFSATSKITDQHVIPTKINKSESFLFCLKFLLAATTCFNNKKKKKIGMSTMVPAWRSVN
jgi:hypothetical protein